MLHTCPNCDVTCAQSATQWTASVHTLHTLHTLHTSRNLGWGGGVGCNDMHCTCTHLRCYAIVLAHMFDATQLHLRSCWMLRNCTCAHVRCYAIALAHMLDATQLHLRTCWMLYAIALGHMFDATQLHLGTCSMLRNCTCAHVGCYAIALAHMFDATQLHLRTCWMLRNCTCAHVGCYAIALGHMFDATQLHWAHVRCYAIALAHMLDATQVHLAHMLDATQLHLRTCSMLRNCTLMLRNCTCAHVRCYAILRTWRAELLRVNPHLSKQQFPQTLSKGVLKQVRNELVSSGLDFTKMGYRLSFYIKMSVLLTGASWRADLVVRVDFRVSPTKFISPKSKLKKKWWIEIYESTGFLRSWEAPHLFLKNGLLFSHGFGLQCWNYSKKQGKPWIKNPEGINAVYSIYCKWLRSNMWNTFDLSHYIPSLRLAG